MGQIRTLDPRDVREVFIETGYGAGASLEAVVELGFEEVYSIEIDPRLAARATRKWEGRVHVIRGDSREVLPRLIDPSRPTTFWLDAHYSDGIFGEEEPPDHSPLLEELAIITSADWTAPHTILVDDVRLLGVEEGWPTLDAVLRALRGRAYDVVVGPGAPDDLLVARG